MKILATLMLTILMPIGVYAGQDKCAYQINEMQKSKNNLVKILDTTKSYVKGNSWIYSNKQLEINGNWLELDDVLENEEYLEKSLPIINDLETCNKSTKLTIEAMDYIRNGNDNIIRDIDSIIKNASEIVKITGCKTQNSCDGFFGFYLQKKMSDYGFYQYGGLNVYMEAMKKDRKELPPVNLIKKELILY